MSNRFRATGRRGASQPGASYGYAAKPAAIIVARNLCRFAYLERPAGLSRYQFETACLLQARCKPPFVQSGHLVLQNRDGAAIWWWDEAALLLEANSAGRPSASTIPESVSQQLPDGWYHVRLAEGFEARHVERGMVIGSAWRRQPFGQSDWQAFVSGEGGALVGPCVPPSIIDADTLRFTARPGGGRVLERAISWQERAIFAAVLGAAVLGGWWHGEAAGLARSTERAVKETARLEQVMSEYALFVKTRKEQALLSAAQAAAGNGTAAIRFAAVLRLAAARKLQVTDLRLDQSELALSVRFDGPGTGLRALAGELEALPHFSDVTASPGAEPGEMRLLAKVNG